MTAYKLLGRLLLIVAVPFAMSSAVVEPVDQGFSFATTTDLSEIKVMTYNVTNLFDAEHDEGKNDFAFLPKDFPGRQEQCERIRNPYYQEDCLIADWTDSRVDLKIKQIKRVLDSQGDYPDVLALQEVENPNVVGRLAKELGYARFVMTSSLDKRGIDVALLFREDKLVYISHEDIPVVHDKIPAEATRNFLRVVFGIRNGDPYKRIAVYVNHWPASSAPTFWRSIVAGQLREIIDNAQKTVGPANYHAIVLGDFNSRAEEFPNPFYSLLYDNRWLFKLVDTFDYAKRNSSDKTMIARMPPGTYWYVGENIWHRFDRILVSPNLTDKTELEIVPDSFRIVAPPLLRSNLVYTSETHYFYGTKIEGIPFRYNFNVDSKAKAGFSDHFPVTVKIRFQ